MKTLQHVLSTTNHSLGYTKSMFNIYVPKDGHISICFNVSCIGGV